MIRRIAHRIGQGVQALTVPLRPVDYAAAADMLSPPLMALFRRMRRSEQLHSLSVMRALRAQGHTHPDLLVAALLHDAGKSRYPLTIFGRVVVVLAGWIMPRRARVWATGEPHGWRRPFVIAAQHPAWSAEDMAAAGASALAVALARRHQEYMAGEPQTEEDCLLVLLQAVDDRS